MKRVLGTIACVTLAGGCGDPGRPQLSPAEVLARLRGLPGVTADEQATATPDVHYFVLNFTQPIDHDDPSLGTFQQEVSLLHRSEQAPVPMIVHTSGYMDYDHDHTVELTDLLAANQISIEHRLYGDSRPQVVDWSKLTIKQMADDEHDIIQALRTIYEGAFVTTGGSKGGMTAVFHRKFYPDDVEGTVPYVAPLSFGAPDGRYAAFLDTVGLPDCRQAVRDVATELLTNRRDAMVAQAAAQTADSYSRISIGAAFEDAVMNLEWAYWQIKGVKACTDVPKVTASDADLFAWLDMVSPVTEDDDAMVQYMAPYVYQTYAQLGFPDYGAAYLEPLRRYTDSDYASELPTAIEPHFDATAMQEIDDYVEHMGNRLLFIYGQWDPWTAGRFVLGDAADSASLIEAQGTHLSKIMGLDPTDLQTAFAMLTAWTGVTPEPSRIHWAARQRQPTELVVSTRALRARPAQK